MILSFSSLIPKRNFSSCQSYTGGVCLYDLRSRGSLPPRSVILHYSSVSVFGVLALVRVVSPDSLLWMVDLPPRRGLWLRRPGSWSLEAEGLDTRCVRTTRIRCGTCHKTMPSGLPGSILDFHWLVWRSGGRLDCLSGSRRPDPIFPTVSPTPPLPPRRRDTGVNRVPETEWRPRRSETHLSGPDPPPVVAVLRGTCLLVQRGETGLSSGVQLKFPPHSEVNFFFYYYYSLNDGQKRIPAKPI